MHAPSHYALSRSVPSVRDTTEVTCWARMRAERLSRREWDLVPDITPIRLGDSVPLLHADKPTSGLDARAAAPVIRTVCNIADSVNA